MLIIWVGSQIPQGNL